MFFQNKLKLSRDPLPMLQLASSARWTAEGGCPQMSFPYRGIRFQQNFLAQPARYCSPWYSTDTRACGGSSGGAGRVRPAISAT